MKLAHFFIDHPRFAVVLNVFIVVFGLGQNWVLGRNERRAAR